MDRLKKILVLHGPNLNLLGTREPEIYGSTTLADINGLLRERAAEAGLQADFMQSNHEGALVDAIQQAPAQGYCFIILNAAAFTHYSVAVRDAIAAIGTPVIEVHLSNIFRREAFRHRSHVSRAATGLICGLGLKGYVLAIEAMAELIA